MTDWTRVHAYQQHAYTQIFPITSFLIAGTTSYKDSITSLKIDDILIMEFEPTNQYDTDAIVIKDGKNICGYLPKYLQEKFKSFVPSQVKVIDKRRFDGDKYSIRVDII
jgi:hypothetical protein